MPRLTREIREVANFAAGLPEAFLLCREMGHQWRPYAAEWNQPERCYERILRCRRCKTDRRQQLSSSGAVLTSTYDYPDGYTHEGMGRITGEGRDRLRLESVTRMFPATEDERSA